MKPALAHAAIAVFAAVAMLVPPPAIAADPEPAATILDVEGPVSWHAQAETAFHDARGGEKLFPGAVVKTGVKGYAHLLWRNGGDFRLLPLSELAVPEEEGVLLNAGKVWAQFKHKLLVPFFFKSPTATAVVRGTILGVEITPDGGTTVAVTEGRVEVSGRNGEPTRLLEPGQALTVTPFGMLGPIQPVQPQQAPTFERFNPQTPNQQPPQGPRGGMEGPRSMEGPRPGGPRPEGPRPNGMVEWLQQNRASTRLETTRQQMRMREMPRPDQPNVDGGQPGRPPGMGHMRPDDRRYDDRRHEERRGLGAPVVSPDRAFPAGRPPEHMEPPCTPPPPGMTVICTPPPPPPNAPGAIAPMGPVPQTPAPVPQP